jgi:site-specific DNA-methyltransferase (adenine-specific)
MLGFRKRGGVQFAPIDPADITKGLLRRSSRWVVLFCAVEQIGDYARASGGAWVRGGIWRKPDAMPQFSGDRPSQWGEGIAIMHPGGKKVWNGKGGRAEWTVNIERTDRHHETQKPLPLMLDLVRLFSDPGELVWDPYAGSATTGVACLRLGRRFLGHEMQEHYFEIACERLRAEKRGLTLQQARAGQTSILDVLGDND